MSNTISFSILILYHLIRLSVIEHCAITPFWRLHDTFELLRAHSGKRVRVNWKIVNTNSLTQSLLLALLNNDIAAVRIPHFVDSNMCHMAIHGIQKHGIEYYVDDPEMGRIGITQAEHQLDIVSYFAGVPRAEAVRQEIFKGERDPLKMVMETLGQQWDGTTELAFERRFHQHYFAGLVRVIKRTLLHFDWAPHDAQDWAIGNISAQLAWNIFFQASEHGGITRIYQRPWMESDEKYRTPGNYAYPSVVIDGCSFVEVSPLQGELVLFNSRNYHEVDKTEGNTQRITMSSFIGLVKPSKQLLFWS